MTSILHTLIPHEALSPYPTIIGNNFGVNCQHDRYRIDQLYSSLNILKSALRGSDGACEAVASDHCSRLSALFASLMIEIGKTWTQKANSQFQSTRNLSIEN